MAKSTPLAFERIRIHRLPGIDGGLTLDGFSAGINIIHGPNSSGKTSSARALRMLLWPRLAEEARAALAGSFTTDGVRWTVEVDIDRHEWQREGQPAAAPALVD